MIPNADQVARERLRQDNASKGPSYTFLCKGPCHKPSVITGRRKVNGDWWCKHCVAAS